MVSYKDVTGEIMSPLEVQTVLTKKLSDDLYKFWSNKISRQDFIDSLIFESSSITICGLIKIYLLEGKICFRLIGPIDSDKKHCFLDSFLANFDDIKQLFNTYLYQTAYVTQNYDETISTTFVKNLHNDLLSGKVDPLKSFYIPLENKIKHLLDDGTIKNKLEQNHNTYGLKFNCKSNKANSIIHFSLFSAILNNGSLIEIDYLKNGTVDKDDLYNFLVRIFFYGDLIR